MNIQLIETSVARLKEFAPVIFGAAGTCGIEPPTEIGETKEQAYLAGYVKALETVGMLFNRGEN